MSQPYRNEDLDRRLVAPTPEPPEHLLDTLREEIPEDLTSGAPATRRWERGRRWQAVAAVLLIGVVGLLVGDRVLREGPSVESFSESDIGTTVTVPPGSDPAVADRDPVAAAGATQESAREQSQPVASSSDEEEPSGERLDRRNPAGDSEPKKLEARDLELRQARADAVGPRQATEGVVAGSDSTGPADRQDATRRQDFAATPGKAAEPSGGRTRKLAERSSRKVVYSPPPPASTTMPTPETEAPSAPRRVAPDDLSSVGSLNEPMVPSTGGTTEPNDQPYGDMFFESAGVNPSIDTEDDPLSTFGLDVDSGSYTMARSYVERGHLPPAEAVRVEEFVNYFDYGDRPPRRGDFALSAEGAPTPFAEGPRYHVLRFGVHGRVIDREDRRPANLVFVVDVSGSMGRENRLGLVRRSLELLLDELTPDDRVGLVVYGSRGEVLLEPSADHEEIRRAIERLQPGGSTNAEEGLVLAYQQARRHFRRGAINRVILCSDGVANVGRTGSDSILERIGREAEAGIELTTVGFGMGNYNDVLMEQLANRGDGRYAYVDTLAEARRLFVENLTGTLQTIASDAKVQVEFDRRSVSRYRLLGYENRDIADERFRDDTVDAGEIGAGHQVTAVYEIKLTEDARPRDRLARIHLRWRSAASEEVEEIALDLHVRDLAPSWERSSAGLQLASIVAEFAEILRRSYWAREGDLDDLLRRAQRLSPEFSGDPGVAELVGLVAKAARLQAGSSSDR